MCMAVVRRCKPSVACLLVVDSHSIVFVVKISLPSRVSPSISTVGVDVEIVTMMKSHVETLPLALRLRTCMICCMTLSYYMSAS